MKKEEFLRELSELLSDLPDVEREEALEFYADYIDDVGDDEEAMRQIGSPALVAQRVKAGLIGNPEESIEYTEQGYKDQFDEQEKAQLTPKARRTASASGERESATSEEKPAKKSRGWLLVLGIIVVLFVGSRIANGVIRYLRYKNAYQNQNNYETYDAWTGWTYEAGAVNTLRIEVNAGNVEIVMDPHDTTYQIRIEETSAVTSQSFDGDTLEIECDASGLALFGDHTVRIAVPNTYLNRVEVEVNAGNVTFDHLMTNKFIAEVNAGNLMVDGLALQGNASIETNAGNAQIRLLGSETSYNYHVDVSLGNVIINGNSFAQLNKSTLIKNEVAYRTIDLTSNMGNIDVTTED